MTNPNSNPEVLRTQARLMVEAAYLFFSTGGKRSTTRDMILKALEFAQDAEVRSLLENALGNVENRRGTYDDNAIELLGSALTILSR